MNDVDGVDGVNAGDAGDAGDVVVGGDVGLESLTSTEAVMPSTYVPTVVEKPVSRPGLCAARFRVQRPLSHACGCNQQASLDITMPCALRGRWLTLKRPCRGSD